MTEDGRDRASVVLVWLTFVITLISAPLLYVSNLVGNEDRFVALTDKIIDHPSVRQEIASEVTSIAFASVEADEAIAEALPDAARPLAGPLARFASEQATAAAFAVLDTETATQARHVALREVHSQFTADSEVVVIDLRAVLVRTARDVGGPTAGTGVANAMKGTDAGRYVIAEPGSSSSAIIDLVRSLPAIGRVMTAIGVAVLIVGILVAADRRRALVRGGLTILAAVSIVVVGGGALLHANLGGDRSPLGPEVGRAAAETLSTDFSNQQLGAVLTGLALATLGLLLGERTAARGLRQLPRSVWQRDRGRTHGALADIVGDNPALGRLLVWLAAGLTLAAWQQPSWRVVGSVVVLAAIAHTIIWLYTSDHRRAISWRDTQCIDAPVTRPPSSWLRGNLAALVVAGFFVWPIWDRTSVVAFLLILAVSQIAADVAPARHIARSRHGLRHQPATSDTAVSATRLRPTWLIAAVLSAVAIGAVLTVTSTDSVAAGTGCNGQIELCDRPVDEVVFAGSHNSMASTDLGWDLAMQTGDLTAQLDHGIRALLIDAVYWGQPNDRLDVAAGDAESKALLEAALADDVPQPGTWLCHNFCALGATALEAGLASIDLWLEANPREVIMLVIQDEISTVDLVAAFEASGLVDRVHDHRPGEDWPTLGELIEVDERVIVYAENEGNDNSWYQNAWDSAFTDTPFAFALRSEFSCETNRGHADNTFLLVNHWITSSVPVIEVAEAVNTAEVLQARVDQCVEQVGRSPSVIAVDFAQSGELVDFVAELNTR